MKDKCPVCGQDVEEREGRVGKYVVALVKAQKGEKGCFMCGGKVKEKP